MVQHPRPSRVVLVGARMRLANMVADLVNVSQTGVLIRAGSELRADSVWPLVLELPATPAVALTGRVVRCERAEISTPGGAALRSRYDIALRFMNRSAEAQAILEDVCGTVVDTGRAAGGAS